MKLIERSMIDNCSACQRLSLLRDQVSTSSQDAGSLKPFPTNINLLLIVVVYVRKSAAWSTDFKYDPGE